jgi:hypothetical protein
VRCCPSSECTPFWSAWKWATLCVPWRRRLSTNCTQQLCHCF